MVRPHHLLGAVMSITEQARAELDRIGFGDEDTVVMMTILDMFFDQFDSGGAVSVVAPVLQRLIAGKPLSPLTGADDEWFKPMDDMDCFQNCRCGSVFKEKTENGDWFAYDIDGPDRSGTEHIKHRWARKQVVFPYSPGETVVCAPVIEVETKEPL